jgi:Rho-binding antiterminator
MAGAAGGDPMEDGSQVPAARSDYVPISCEFHDILEATATTRKVVRLQFVDDGNSLHRRDDRIVDVYSRAGAEYVTLGSGETVRLDRLRSVDGVGLGDLQPLGRQSRA